MKKWQYWTLGIVGLLCLGGIFGVVQHQRTQHYWHTHTPTVFVHGWRGGAHSTDQMITAAENAGAAHKALTVRIGPRGQLTYSGYWQAKRRNPIIQVVFTNNQAGEVQYTRWLMKLMQDLKQRYQIKQINLVGHSMGAYAVVAYAMKASNQTAFPRLNKLVAIAGPFNGIIGHQVGPHPNDGTTWTDRPHQNHLLANGRPATVHPEYKRLVKMRHRFPSQTHVLNIYGNLKDGSASDGVVTLVSAKSLKYLVADQAASYHSKAAYGTSAAHSQLHENNPVGDHALLTFLWDK